MWCAIGAVSVPPNGARRPGRRGTPTSVESRGHKNSSLPPKKKTWLPPSMVERDQMWIGGKHFPLLLSLTANCAFVFDCVCVANSEEPTRGQLALINLSFSSRRGGKPGVMKTLRRKSTCLARLIRVQGY